MSSRKILFIAILVSMLSLIGLNAQAQQEDQRSIKQLKAEIQNAKDTNQRREVFKKLRTIKPETVNDVSEIVNIIRSANNEEEKEDALHALKEIKEDDKHLESEFIKLLDDSDRDIRTASIINLGKLKTKEAAPKLREIVKSFSKIKYIEYKSMHVLNMRKAFKIILEPGAAAMALGEMKDEEAIPILVEKFDELEGFGAVGLSKIGKKALPAILDLAKKETDRKNAYAQRALADIEDKEAKEDLINILKTEKNRDIRMRVLVALKRHMFDDEVLELVKNLYEKEKDTMFLTAMRTKKAIPFLVNILANDKDRNARRAAVGILDDITDESVIPALEKALKDSDSEVREVAVYALIPIADRDSLMRLKDYINSNFGKIGRRPEFDKTMLKVIDSRLKSGKRGPISLEEMEEATEQK